MKKKSLSKKTERLAFRDEVVIYISPEDGNWVAHSLRTDQIGCGESPAAALAEQLRLTHALLREAERDRTIAIFRDAPPEVLKIKKSAKKLPGEIYEVAHKKALGSWPDSWKMPEPEGDSATAFRAEITDGNLCPVK